VEELYCCEFNQPIKVEKKGDLYTLKIYIHGYKTSPIVINTQCNDDEEFYQFIKKELTDRQLIRSSFGKLKIYGNIETQEGL